MPSLLLSLILSYCYPEPIILMITTMQDVLILVLSIGLGLFFIMCSVFVGALAAFVFSLKNLSTKGEELMDNVNTYVTMPATLAYTVMNFFKGSKKDHSEKEE
ncbi:MAG: hypothetical protein ACK4NC_00990 [Candidatus Gracilibacteria bacterium]